MRIARWLRKNTQDLTGKRVAITGSTGGIGRWLCHYLLSLGASLILVDRNAAKQESLIAELVSYHPSADISRVIADLEDIESVKDAAEKLVALEPDVFIHNAGAYAIPRRVSSSGYDNVFTINFISPYYIIRRLLPHLNKVSGRVVVVGSIAHRYSKSDVNDIDFSTRKRASLVYGNAKRYLMAALPPLFDGLDCSLAVTHPGITFTGITAHYPKLIFAIIKHPMKVIFMKPRRAALSVLYGVFSSTASNEWIGPRIFGIWGLPRRTVLRGISAEEVDRITTAAQSIYRELSK